ncbi:MAG: T9SS type A sorting domain-containing protein, partial [Bacteroidales bacterium]|nr:T9SS type A sorting domain-containing protein [Bacteroidales bacterium]
DTNEQAIDEGLTVTIEVSEGLQQRLVLLEHFTNTSCGPCAEQNPALKALVKEEVNKGKVLYITYHSNYPGSDDHFYLANPEQNSNRILYYGINAVPTVHLAGNKKVTSPNNITQNDIDREYARPGFVAANGGHKFEEMTLEVELSLTNAESFEDRNMVTHIVVSESHEYDSAPGNNGEKDFPNVMRQMLTGDEGTALVNTDKGESNEYRFSYELPDDMTTANAQVGFFVQDADTKEVVMAGLLPVDTSIDKNELDAQISLTPNPTKGLLFIQSPAIVDKVEVYNINGSKVLDEPVGTMQHNTQLGHLSNGLYIVKLYIGNSVVVKRVMKN